MPAMKDYVVEQTRRVLVTANDIHGALFVADRAFAGEMTASVNPYGYATGTVEDMRVTIVKEQ